MNIFKPAKRLDNIPEYVFARLNSEVKRVEEKSGKKVLNFGQGTPDFKPSKKYIRKYQEYIASDDAHLYPGYKAIPELANALVSWYKTRFNVALASDEVLPLLGAKDGISHLPLAFLDPGDEVLVPDPGYPAYTESALLVGAKPVPYKLPAKHNFRLSIDELEKRVTKKTKCLWVNFPSNPTGQAATLEELTALAEFVKRHSLFILYDNAYSEITFDGFVPPSILELGGAKDFAIEFGTFSKMSSFAGFRMGWVVGNREAIATLLKMKSQMDSGLSLPLQKLGAYVLMHPDKAWQKQMVKSYVDRRDRIAEKLTQLDMQFVLPKSALYIWARIPKNEKSSWDFCMRMLNEKQILFTPGTAFGKNGEGYVRVSFSINIDNIDNYFSRRAK